MRPSGSTGTATAKPPRTPRALPHMAFDPGGIRIMRVPLTRGRVATLLHDDFKSLEAAGVPFNWYWNDDGKGHGYVRASIPGIGKNLVMVARLLLRVPSGFIIRYADKDPTNLRRSNLVTDKGFSKEREQYVQDTLAAHAARQERIDAEWAASVGGHWAEESWTPPRPG